MKTSKQKINRRKFIGAATTASLAFTIVPRHTLGGVGFVPTSEKLTLGCGEFHRWRSNKQRTAREVHPTG
jgi:hypothetical protein